MIRSHCCNAELTPIDDEFQICIECKQSSYGVSMKPTREKEWTKELEKLIKINLYGFEVWEKGEYEIKLYVALTAFIESLLAHTRAQCGKDMLELREEIIDYFSTYPTKSGARNFLTRRLKRITMEREK